MALDLPELRSIDLDGPISYREWEGPPETTFVLVHGLGGSQLSWALVASGLSGLGRTVALDLPGFGETPRFHRDCGLMSHRRTLSRFLGEVAGERVIVCGNSMGGAVGILQAAIEPDSMAGLTLTCSVMPPLRRSLPHPLVMGVFSMYGTPRIGERFVAMRFAEANVEPLVRKAFAFLAADGRSVPEDMVRATVELERRRRADPQAQVAFLETARSMMRLGRRPDVADRAIRGVGCPVLMMHGLRDRLVPAAWAESVLARRPDWRGRIFPDLGHIPQIEAPGRWLAEVADWHSDVA